MNLKEWRKRKEREAKSPKAKVVRMEPETLLERLLRYARLSGSQYVEKPYKVDCFINGVVVTVYREPAQYMGGTRMFLFYGEVFYPYRKCCRLKYLNEHCAKLLYDRLAKEMTNYKKI